ncbi:TrmB family transcriptional regulator [candidate division KSB1 bacterium]
MVQLDDNILEGFGLSKNEAKVYTTLLRTGLTTVGKISDKSKVHRTNVYDVVERLIEKGLICYVVKDGTKCYEATNPENLMNVLKEKEIQLRQILPKLMLDKQLAEKKSEVHVYEGVSSVKMMLNHFIDKKKERITYGVPKGAVEHMKEFMKHYHERRIDMKIPMRHIYNEDAKERREWLNSLDLTEARYLPQEFNSPVSTSICGDEVVIIMWTKTPLVIQIVNEELADSYKNYFEVLWKIAEK